MAVDDVTICNSALIKLGQDPIDSLDDTHTKAARVCKRQYPLVRDLLLEEYNWTFAMERVSLAPDQEAPAFGFSSKFLLPANCLRVVGLYDETEPVTNYTTTKVPFKVEGRYLLMDGDRADIFYIRNDVEPPRYSPQFVECVALRLAIDLSYDLTGGEVNTGRLEQRFQEQIRKARFAQAIQGTPEIIQSTELLEARHHAGRVIGNPWAFGGQGF